MSLAFLEIKIDFFTKAEIFKFPDSIFGFSWKIENEKLNRAKIKSFLF